MARKLSIQSLRRLFKPTRTYEGAAAYDYSEDHALIHLCFSMGSALFSDGFYESEREQVRRYTQALLKAAEVEPKFPWQYAAWMRDIRRGKGNRIQGSLAPALLDSFLGETPFTERYTYLCLSQRADDVTAFLRHYERLDLGRPSPAARRGMAQALASYDEYQLMKYAQPREQVRLCDVILFLRSELEALGDDGALALAVGQYLHAPTRLRAERLRGLPMTQARRELWRQEPHYALGEEFPRHVQRARVTWEQLYSHFASKPQESEKHSVQRRDRRLNLRLWRVLLAERGLLGDLALLRNLRNMNQAGLGEAELIAEIKKRHFRGIWPQQVYAGFMTEASLERSFNAIFKKMIAQLPPGRHLGLGDASGSMMVPVGGAKGTLKAMDLAFCFVGLMSETSGLGASFSDDGFKSWSGGRYLAIAKRSGAESALSFSRRSDVRKGMGGTQVAGAVIELILWLKKHPEIEPPDCLWFFSDMQFHPAAGQLPSNLHKGLRSEQLKMGAKEPPLEAALKLYRHCFGAVDVVLWNLAAYSPVPVPSEMEGILLVSGFDANTFRSVAAWREGKELKESQALSENQGLILELIRSF